MEQGPHGRDGSDVWNGAVVDEATGGRMLGLLASVATDLLASHPGISIIGSGHLRTLCARPHLVDALDLVQFDHGGPSMDAMEMGTIQAALLSEHLTDWADLEQQSREVGYTSIHAFPIRGPAGMLGTLSLYSTSAQLSDPDMHIATGIARAAGSVITHTGDLPSPQIRRSDARRDVGELRAALDLIGAGPDDLFIRYFAIGGTNSRSHVGAIMAGRREVSAHELDTIDLAVGELVDQHRRNPANESLSHR